MEIKVLYKKKWGKDLFYPVNDDAKFITELTKRPTILKNQLKVCQEKGYKVEIIIDHIDPNQLLEIKAN